MKAIIEAAMNDRRDDEFRWLSDTLDYLWFAENGMFYGNGPGDGVGHGDDQFYELYNLIDVMQNGGTWDVLGDPLKENGDPVSLDPAFLNDESNDGTGGQWSNFSPEVGAYIKTPEKIKYISQGARQLDIRSKSRYNDIRMDRHSHWIKQFLYYNVRWHIWISSSSINTYILAYYVYMPVYL